MFQYVIAFILGGLVLGPVVVLLVGPGVGGAAGFLGGLAGVGIALYINHREYEEQARGNRR